MENDLRKYRRNDWNGIWNENHQHSGNPQQSYICLPSDTLLLRMDGSEDIYGNIITFRFQEAKSGRRKKKVSKKEQNSKNMIQNHSEEKEVSDQKSGSQIMALAQKRRIRRRRIHKLIVILLVAAAFCFGFFGRTLFEAYAEEESAKEYNRYYTSIQLEPGDNLWNIASRYSQGSGYTVSEYVEELKRMNGLKDGHVHSGEYLTVVYFAE